MLIQNFIKTQIYVKSIIQIGIQKVKQRIWNLSFYGSYEKGDRVIKKLILTKLIKGHSST